MSILITDDPNQPIILTSSHFVIGRVEVLPPDNPLKSLARAAVEKFAQTKQERERQAKRRAAAANVKARFGY